LESPESDVEKLTLENAPTKASSELINDPDSQVKAILEDERGVGEGSGDGGNLDFVEDSSVDEDSGGDEQEANLGEGRDLGGEQEYSVATELEAELVFAGGQPVVDPRYQKVWNIPSLEEPPRPLSFPPKAVGEFNILEYINQIEYQDNEEESFKRKFKELYVRSILEEEPLKTNSSNPEFSLTIKEPEETLGHAKIIIEHLAYEHQKLSEKIKKINDPDDKATTKEDSQSPIEPVDRNPIVYYGVGIKMRLETETKDEVPQYSLKVIGIFKNSALNQDDMDKKIKAVNVDGEYKSITSIFEESNGDLEKFFSKISSIFYDPNSDIIKLEFEDKSLKEYTKKLFCSDSLSSVDLDNSKDVVSALSQRQSSSVSLIPTDPTRSI